MVRVSSEKSCPAAVITAIRPVVAPAFEIADTGITIVVPFPEVAEIVLLRQNFTVIDPLNPVPVIVKFPPALNESVRVESPVMDGGVVVSIE